MERRGVVDAVSRLRALAARRVSGTVAPRHMPRSNATKSTTERCAVEKALLRTFSLSPQAGFGSLVRTLVELGIYPANVLILRVFLRKENSAVGDVGQNPDQPREAADFPGGERFFEI